MSASTGPIRRNFIAGSLAALAGALGLNFGHGVGTPARAATHDASLLFYGRRKMQPGNHAGPKSTITVLYKRVGGPRVGQTQTTSFAGASPVQAESTALDAAPVPGLLGASSVLEFHSVQLSDGTLFGIGGPRPRTGTVNWAIVGGTGRFAAASGVCTETPTRNGGEEIEVAITLSA